MRSTLCFGHKLLLNPPFLPDIMLLGQFGLQLKIFLYLNAASMDADFHFRKFGLETRSRTLQNTGNVKKSPKDLFDQEYCHLPPCSAESTANTIP